MIFPRSQIVASHINKLTNDEFAELRRGGIGASSMAGVLSMSPYQSPMSVYLQTVYSLDVVWNEAMSLGKALEPFIASQFTEQTGIRVTFPNVILKHPEYDWLRATPDCVVSGKGQRVIVELKASGYAQGWGSMSEESSVAVPEHYQVQVQQNLAVTGFDYAYIVLFSALKLRWWKIERDEETIEAIIEGGKRFWELVQNETPPPMDGSEQTTELLNDMYGEPDENPEPDPVWLPDRGERGEGSKLWSGGDSSLAAACCDVYLMKKDDAKKLDSEISLIANQLRVMMGNDTVGETEKGHRVTWKPDKRGNRILRITERKEA